MQAFSKEILDTLQIRKSRAQKAHFRRRLSTYADGLGYLHHEEAGMMGARNFVVGDPTTARVIFTAHYDTCPVLPVPNFITPQRMIFYLAYQFLLTAGIFAVIFALRSLAALTFGWLGATFSWPPSLTELFSSLSHYGAFLFVFALLFFGPANRHTVNDNTSGVITLVELMAALSPEQREGVAFIFFDLEEMGLFGSTGYVQKHKIAMKDKLLLNFDCVSDGDHILFAMKKGASPYADVLAASYTPSEECGVEICKSGVFYPSDQAVFDLGVGVCALKYSKKLKTYYMDRIHTPRDTVMREDNIRYLVSGSVCLCDNLLKNNPKQEETTV